MSDLLDLPNVEYKHLVRYTLAFIRGDNSVEFPFSLHETRQDAEAVRLAAAKRYLGVEIRVVEVRIDVEMP